LNLREEKAYKDIAFILLEVFLEVFCAVRCFILEIYYRYLAQKLGAEQKTIEKVRHSRH
jgi:hypothetical protein